MRENVLFGYVQIAYQSKYAVHMFRLRESACENLAPDRVKWQPPRRSEEGHESSDLDGHASG